MVLNFNSVGNIQGCMATLICMLKYGDFLILRDMKRAQKIYKVFNWVGKLSQSILFAQRGKQP